MVSRAARENRMYTFKSWGASLALAASLVTLLAGCGSMPPAPVADAGKKSASTALPPTGSGKGGYYLDDGPGDNAPANLDQIPDAVPRIEAPFARNSRPYTVFGKTYVPVTDGRSMKERGKGSWYGKKFHGQKTSSGELYDMYTMTAAHPTMPLPSYARVTNLETGKQVIVRVNDRGPFLNNRIIDLSYTAALKLGYIGKGSAELEVERLLPDEIARMENERINGSRIAPVVDFGVTPSSASVVTVAVALPQAGSIEALPSSRTTDAGSPGTSAPLKTASGFYLQMGAFSQAANAETARARLAQGWSSTLPQPEVAQQDTLYRLYSGPFATRAEAEAAARAVEANGQTKALIVQR
jgi:rare lipoprotein A